MVNCNILRTLFLSEPEGSNLIKSLCDFRETGYSSVDKHYAAAGPNASYGAPKRSSLPPVTSEGMRESSKGEVEGKVPQ